MDLDDLRGVQASERSTDSLQSLSDSFYREVVDYIDGLREERTRAAERAADPFGSEDVRRLSDEIETAQEVAEAIYDRRVGKVVKRASLAAAGMPADEEGLTDEEARLFSDLVDHIESHRGSVLSAFAGEDPTETAASEEPRPESARTARDPDRGAQNSIEVEGDSAEKKDRVDPEPAPESTADVDPPVDLDTTGNGDPTEDFDTTGDIHTTEDLDTTGNIDTTEDFDTTGDVDPTEDIDTATAVDATANDGDTVKAVDATANDDDTVKAVDATANDDDTVKAVDATANDDDTAGAVDATGSGDKTVEPFDPSTDTGDTAAPATHTDGNLARADHPTETEDAQAPEEAPVPTEAESSGDAPEKAISRTTVRITQDVGELMGVDEHVYELANEDVVTLPEANADPLIDRDAAKRID